MDCTIIIFHTSGGDIRSRLDVMSTFARAILVHFLSFFQELMKTQLDGRN